MRRHGVQTRWLVLGLALAVAGCGTGDRPMVASGGGDSVSTWNRASASPLPSRVRTVLVWTGREVLVLGGDHFSCPPSAGCTAPTEAPLLDAAAFDPETATWRRLAPAPIGFHSAAGTAVVGDDVYVLALTDYESGIQLLRYDLVADEWERLAPRTYDVWHRLVAVDDRLVAYVGSEETGVTGDATFDPATGEWAPLPEDPLSPGFDRTMVWAAPHLYLFDHEHVPNPGSDGPSVVRAARFDPLTGEWERLPDSELIGGWGPWLAEDGRLITPLLGQADGGDVNGWDRPYLYGGALDTRTRTWHPLPEPPEAAAGAPGSVPPTAGALGQTSAIFLDTRGWLLDAESGTWSWVPQVPGAVDHDPVPIVTVDRSAVAFVGNALWQYTPTPRSDQGPG